MTTRSPRAVSRLPRLEAVRPLPSEEATPPVTKMCCVRARVKAVHGTSCRNDPRRPSTGPRVATPVGPGRVRVVGVAPGPADAAQRSTSGSAQRHERRRPASRQGRRRRQHARRAGPPPGCPSARPAAPDRCRTAGSAPPHGRSSTNARRTTAAADRQHRQRAVQQGLAVRRARGGRRTRPVPSASALEEPAQAPALLGRTPQSSQRQRRRSPRARPAPPRPAGRR